MTIFRCAIAVCLFLVSASAPAIAEPLTLRDALTRALHDNPELAQYPFQQRIAEAAKLQASLRPNPELSIEVENVLGTGKNRAFENLQTTLSFSQLIELGAKREQRIALAEAETQRVTAEFNYSKVEVLAETTARYYHALKLQQLVDWYAQQQQRLEHSFALAQERVKLGAAPAGEMLRVRLQQQRIAAEMSNAEGRLAEARIHLSAMWAAMPDFNTLLGNFAEQPAVPGLAALDQAVNEAPELLRLFDSERVLAAKLNALEAAATADLTLGGGIRYSAAADDLGFVLQASIPWQLSNPQAGHLAANKAERDSLHLQQRKVRQELRARARVLQARAETDQRFLKQLQSQLIPTARELEQTTLAGYEDGIYSLLQVLDAQNELASLEQEQLQRQYAIYRSLLELERLTGHTFVEASL
ncbi:TolC family protein [Pseudidiomarina insulisalsae]|uniref:TolC family protein n=1 Tax=Pseudidiomarina insulisalsae TaxID=575789 RepID=A0A432YQU5_9GAMM|nr:TolC family protein [Pseudidiomarina insulisalsae]RUO63646.1 TolC family protein [Pseudidiomarina insulisalsae]